MLTISDEEGDRVALLFSQVFHAGADASSWSPFVFEFQELPMALRMALRSPLTIAALFAVALFVGTCFPSDLSDAERVWCDDRTVTVIAAADALNIGPELKGSIDSPETLAQWPYRKASGDRDWVRACKAAYEGR